MRIWVGETSVDLRLTYLAEPQYIIHFKNLRCLTSLLALITADTSLVRFLSR